MTKLGYFCVMMLVFSMGSIFTILYIASSIWEYEVVFVGVNFIYSLSAGEIGEKYSIVWLLSYVLLYCVVRPMYYIVLGMLLVIWYTNLFLDLTPDLSTFLLFSPYGTVAVLSLLLLCCVAYIQHTKRPVKNKKQ